MAEQKCGLMPPGLGPFVQVLLGCMSVAVLAYKCHIDTSGRGTVRFVFDSSKQFAGAAWMHVANMLVAGLLGGVQTGADPCQWYFIEIMVDTTVGVFVEFKILEQIRLWLRDSGYGALADDIEASCVEEPPAEAPAPDGVKLEEGTDARLSSEPSKASLSEQLVDLYKKVNKLKYFKQLAVWLVVVTSMKFVMVVLMLALSPQFEMASGFVLAPLQNPSVKLVVVMITTPCVMNAVQFWLQDAIFVELHQSHRAKLEASAAEEGVEEIVPLQHKIKETDAEVSRLDREEAKKRQTRDSKLCQLLETSKGMPEVSKLANELRGLIEAQTKIDNEAKRMRAEQLDAVCHSQQIVLEDLESRKKGFHKDVLVPAIEDLVTGARPDALEYSPKFSVKTREAAPNEVVAVTGNCQELGFWDPQSAVMLDTSCSIYPRWEKKIALQPGRIHQFRFLILDETTREVIRWEGTPVCSSTAPKDGKQRLLQADETPPTMDFLP